MAQHDYIISNASGAAVRADLNSALSAIVSHNSGATAPTTTYAYMPWADIATGLLKFRNAANTDWVTVGTLASANLGLLVAPSGAGTAGQILQTDGSGVQTWVDPTARLVRATAQASTSGTVVEFLSIPSWAKKITMMLDGVSTSGTSSLRFQLGTSGGFQTTGYTAANTRIGASAVIAAASTGGWDINSATASSTSRGAVTFTCISSDIWVGVGTVASSEPAVSWTSGSKDLAATLDRVRLTTANGTDTFDAGSVNIIYEG